MLITTLVVAVVLGVGAQVIAARARLPAIMPLLLLGVTCGPSGLGLFEPATLGPTLEALVHLGVAVILFEGGLSMQPRRVAEVAGAVRNLTTLGIGVVWTASALLAGLAGLSWPVAALFGAIMTVTGPTVIAPLLRHMTAPARLKTVLVSEGLINDAIGAVLAYLVLQAILRAASFADHAGELLVLLVVGVVAGFAAGSLGKPIVRSRLVNAELTNLAVLATVMLSYLAAELLAPQSGVLAAVVMGFTMSSAELPDLAPLKAFKGQLTTLLISVLFILLAGQLDLSAVAALSWWAVAVVAALIVVVRPLQVLASVRGGQLGGRERLALALMAPRGIVAAAVASLAGRELTAAGHAGGPELEGLVYLAILVTGGWATAMAVALPRLLGFARDPDRRTVVVVGANALTGLLVRLLHNGGRDAVVVDNSMWRVERMRALGVQTHYGDARLAETFEALGIERDTIVVAATTNDELNLLVAHKAHDELGVEHPAVGLEQPHHELGRRSLAWLDLLGGRRIPLRDWLDRLEHDDPLIYRVVPGDETSALLERLEREHPNEVLVLLGWSAGEPTLRVEEHVKLDALVVLVTAGRAADLLAAVSEPVSLAPLPISPPTPRAEP